MFSDTYRYDSVKVAFYIIAYANEHKVSINLTKTQKLLYIAYGANFVFKNDRLCGEHPQAWPYGPVFPNTRKAILKEDDRILYITMNDPLVGELKDDKYLEDLMGFVFRGFGHKTAGQLTVWSHSKGSPWEETTEIPNFRWGDSIPDEYIDEFFHRIIKTPSHE